MTIAFQLRWHAHGLWSTGNFRFKLMKYEQVNMSMPPQLKRDRQLLSNRIPATFNQSHHGLLIKDHAVWSKRTTLSGLDVHSTLHCRISSTRSHHRRLLSHHHHRIVQIYRDGILFYNISFILCSYRKRLIICYDVFRYFSHRTAESS